jgi:hypothetical protein
MEERKKEIHLYVTKTKKERYKEIHLFVKKTKKKDIHNGIGYKIT